MFHFYVKKKWLIAWLITLSAVLLCALLNKVKDDEKQIFSDQATHIMAAMSIWHDYDLQYSINDLRRFQSLFTGAPGPGGLFLKQNSDGKLIFAKPFLYAGFTAPFYGLFGSSGFIIANFLIILFLSLLIFKSIHSFFGIWRAHVFTLVFICFSPFMAWISIPHPDLLISLLLMSGGYLLLSGQTIVPAIFGGLLLGLSVFEKPTFALIVPFILLSAVRLSWKLRLYVCFSILAGWVLPTSINILQDGNILSYQGSRFYVSNVHPFPLEPGWLAPATGLTDHIFNVSSLTLTLFGNLTLLPQKIYEFFLGRQTGILLYHPIAIYFLMAIIFFRSRLYCIIPLGFFAYMALNWLAFPSNGFGGTGSYGSRYLMQALPVVTLSFLNYGTSSQKPVFENIFLRKYIGWVFVFLSIIFQYKVLPPSENAVQYPTHFLTTCPATMFPIEHSILPCIPLLTPGFRNTSIGNSTELYLTKGFDGKNIIMKSARDNAQIVLYQYAGSTPVPDLVLSVTAPTAIHMFSSGKMIWQGTVESNEPSVVKLEPGVFKRQYYDLQMNSVLRWAPIQLEFISPHELSKELHAVDISFANNTAKGGVAFDKVIPVADFEKTGIKKRFGWSTIEPWGMWSDGYYADLQLSFPGMVDYELELLFFVHRYMTAQHPTQKVDIYVNNNRVDQWNFGDATNPPSRLIRINHQSIQENLLTIGFRMLNPASPATLGHGPDFRTLGIGLKGLQIHAINRN